MKFVQIFHANQLAREAFGMIPLSLAQQYTFEAYVAYSQRVPVGRVDLSKLRRFVHECESVCVYLYLPA